MNNYNRLIMTIIGICYAVYRELTSLTNMQWLFQILPLQFYVCHCSLRCLYTICRLIQLCLQNSDQRQVISIIIYCIFFYSECCMRLTASIILNKIAVYQSAGFSSVTSGKFLTAAQYSVTQSTIWLYSSSVLTKRKSLLENFLLHTVFFLELSMLTFFFPPLT